MDLETKKKSTSHPNIFINLDVIKNLEDLQNFSKELVWQNFERLTAFVFEENNFQVKINTIKTLKKKAI